MFSNLRLWVNAVFPLANIVFIYTGITLFRFFTEEKEKRQIKSAFKQYLSPAVVEELIKDPEKLKLGGEKKELTVLFFRYKRLFLYIGKYAP
ncbi:MAG: hypothetical protein SV062_01875 [Thermodesulfobacteriota bacterium]|nr:hypothetical protein [Thermodesulfobacteriota bacterium]